jgi:hypothetical protein
MKRPGEEREPPGDREERRRRQFEESRGLTAPEKLPLDDAAPAEEPEADEAPNSSDDDEPEGGAP